jgi:phosphoribosylformylglycinamidine cyclo-ligase
VFNCGIGLVAALAKSDLARATGILQAEGETVYEIGAVETGPAGEPQAVVN